MNDLILDRLKEIKKSKRNFQLNKRNSKHFNNLVLFVILLNKNLSEASAIDFKYIKTTVLQDIY